MSAPPIVLTFVDITDRVNVERALHFKIGKVHY